MARLVKRTSSFFILAFLLLVLSSEKLLCSGIRIIPTTEDTTKIYDLFFNRIYNDFLKGSEYTNMFVMDSTMNMQWFIYWFSFRMTHEENKADEKYLKKFFKQNGVSASTIQNYMIFNYYEIPLNSKYIKKYLHFKYMQKKKLDYLFDCKLLPDSSDRKYYERAKDIRNYDLFARNFENIYPKTYGMLSLSNLAFSDDNQEAILFYEWWAGTLAAETSLCIFRKVKDKWKLYEKFKIVVS